LQGGKALAGLDTLDMADALAQTYSRLDYLHPFCEGNSRTLRTFTAQLASEAGHKLDWNTTNVTPQSRDALYVARDLAVIRLRYPDIETADDKTLFRDRKMRQAAMQLDLYRTFDPRHEIIRRSLEPGRDEAPYDRRMPVLEAAREIGVVAPIAVNQADRREEEARLAMLLRKGPKSDHEQALATRDWVAREGNMDELAERLSQIETGNVTIRHEPSAPAIERLTALADGITRELVQQRTIAAPQVTPIRASIAAAAIWSAKPGSYGDQEIGNATIVGARFDWSRICQPGSLAGGTSIKRCTAVAGSADDAEQSRFARPAPRIASLSGTCKASTQSNTQQPGRSSSRRLL
jgi:cell filamentation protein